MSDVGSRAVGYGDAKGRFTPFGPGGGTWPRHWGEAPFDAEERAEWIYRNVLVEDRRKPERDMAKAAIRYANIARHAELLAKRAGP